MTAKRTVETRDLEEAMKITKDIEGGRGYNLDQDEMIDLLILYLLFITVNSDHR